MTKLVALLVVSAAVVGCGASARPTAATGCRGLPTAKHRASLNSLAGAIDRGTTIAYFCAHVGRPLKVNRGVDGRVSWIYASAALTWKRDHLVASEIDATNTNGTYSISQSEIAVSTFSGGDKLHPTGASGSCSQSAGQTLPGSQGL